MEASRRLPHLCLILLLASGTLALLAATSRTLASDVAGVERELPAVAGDWAGADILYCHNRVLHGQLSKLYEGDEATLTHCPEAGCGEPLHRRDVGEAIALPETTDIFKKIYHHPGRPSLTATVVLSGEDRASFHRPVRCIASQGYRVDAMQVIHVPIPGREPVPVKVYDLTLSVEGRPDVHRFFAFWYVGVDRETASHYGRMLWMGYDRLVRNVAHRWAYISVAGRRRPGSTGHQGDLEDFVASFYPQVRRAP